jgi:BirA family transcriptional regulator, biotin operon repressor / biotin---[acetyl-CoA-carboxylase] ligase
MQTTLFATEHFASIDSTNAELLRRAATRSIHARAVSADVQTAGRGQRGRRWHAQTGDALLLSVGWHFAQSQRLEGLSLAIGVAAARATSRFSSDRITLKWPNDLLIDDERKLGGILVETVTNALGERIAAIGIGINVRVPELAEFERIGQRDYLQPAALLADTRPGNARNEQAALLVRDSLRHAILDELSRALPNFAEHGFASIRDDWWAMRAYANTRVRVLASDAESAAQTALAGRLARVEDNGALVIDDGRTLHTLHSGSISLRPTAS